MQANGYGMGTSFSSDGRFDAMLPEVEIVDVELAKDSHGLGITIAGYVCEKGNFSIKPFLILHLYSMRVLSCRRVVWNFCEEYK